jgi:hypothetical protein
MVSSRGECERAKSDYRLERQARFLGEISLGLLI